MVMPRAYNEMILSSNPSKRLDTVELRYFNQRYLEMANAMGGLDSPDYSDALAAMLRGSREEGLVITSYSIHYTKLYEVGAVGRKEPQLGASSLDHGTHRWPLVAGEVVHDDHVAGAKLGKKDS